MYTLYLAGHVTANPLTYEWRKMVENYFEDNKWIDIINPCNSLFDQSASNNSDNSRNDFSITVLKEKGIALLPYKDRGYVKRSDVVFVNMNTYSSERPSIGTFFELAWYFDSPEKMVIGIFDGDPEEAFQCAHPFIKETIQVWVKTPLEACQLLERFMDVKS